MGTPPSARLDFSRAVSEGPGGALVDVWVVPGAATAGIVGLHDDAVRIRVSVPPEDGKANRAVEKALTAIAGSPAELIRGRGSRRKCFLVRGVEPAELARLLAKQVD
jgi:uncharacterized protein (TIGR00251 family)